jgi:hypothetical protein
MVTENLMERVEALELRIIRATQSGRLVLQPELTRMLDRLDEQGLPVPRRLRDMEAALVEDAIESRFDNMPV